jgi:hypothetical protein
MFMANSYCTAAASAVSNESVFPAMDSTAILMLFLIPQMNIHLLPQRLHYDRRHVLITQLLDLVESRDLETPGFYV